jgi:hypothetical protein
MLRNYKPRSLVLDILGFFLSVLCGLMGYFIGNVVIMVTGGILTILWIIWIFLDK